MKQVFTFLLFFIFFPVMFFAQIITPLEGAGFVDANDQWLEVKKQSVVSKQDVAKQVGELQKKSASDFKFYVNRQSGGVNNKYISHLVSDPDVSNVIRNGVTAAENLFEGAMDAEGNWWGLSSNQTIIYKIDKNTGATTDMFHVVNCYGITYNPVDGMLYYVIKNGANTDFYKYDIATTQSTLVRTYAALWIWGLGCTSEGKFYAITNLGGVPIIQFSADNATVTQIGTGINDVDMIATVYIDFEIDPQTNKVYALTRNGALGHGGRAELREIILDGPNAGKSTLAYDFGVVENIQGFAFDLSLVLNNPTQAEVLHANEIYTINWNAGLSFNLKIELSTDGGLSWSLIASGVPSINKSYDWTVPQVNSENCLIKVTREDDINLTNTSKVFTISTPFQFITGNFGENWPTGSDQTISWFQNLNFSPDVAASKKGASGDLPDYIMVEIAYSLNGMQGPWTTAGVVPSYYGRTNTFTVNLPSTTTDQGLFRISSEPAAAGKAAAKGYYSFVVYSTHYFSLYQLPTNNGKLVITSPNGGESYKSGSYQTLQWRKKGIIIGSFLLEYTLDNGLTWNKINTTPVSGSVSRYNWVVPNANSNKCFVRISNYITRELYDISDNSFTITPAAAQSEVANFPNPFNPSTRIIFGLEKSSFTSLKVYNSIGQQVAELVNRQLEAGTHEFEFNATKLPSGVYYYNLTRDGKSEIHKMLLLK